MSSSSSKSSSSSHEIILTSSPHGAITAYDTTSGTVLARFTGSLSPRHGLVLAGKAYIAASHICPDTASASIHLYNWWSSTAFHHLPVPEPVAPLAATPDGSFLFAGGLSGEVYALAIPSGNISSSFRAHTAPVSCLRISNDCSLLISGGDDGVIAVMPILQLVDASSCCKDKNSSNLLLHSFAAHNGPVTDIVCFKGFCHSNIISCSTDCTCRFWDLFSGTKLWAITFPCPISSIILDPTDEEFYAAGSDGLIYKALLKIGSREEARRASELTATWSHQKHGAGILSMVLVNKAKNLVSASEDGSIYVWETDRGQVIMVIGNNLESISDLLVAKGMMGDHVKGPGVKGEVKAGCGESVGVSCQQISRLAEDLTAHEDVLAVAARDRSRAIDMLESAIGVYEKLLELIVKEAKGSSSKNCENKKDSI
ncbi:hypothetical protein Tsubulata_031193 [Turnera subulata]|uniref:Uncharacterized protein n=1 Tax=Turnera subulata TaxID=218843 RepID=A0A9Q0G755_9ROSI|nr:hypothetical protein Tsubulata_031193 [Turnera subulata]